VATLFFTDNTVLVNFAHMRRLDLLANVLNGHGAWSLTVSSECHLSSRQPGLDALDSVGFLGEVFVPTPAERIATQIIRDMMASPGDASTQHQGEAETIAIIDERQLAALIVTDDAGAKAQATQHNIRVITTFLHESERLIDASCGRCGTRRVSKDSCRANCTCSTSRIGTTGDGCSRWLT